MEYLGIVRERARVHVNALCLAIIIAQRYIHSMKPVLYTTEALRNLKRHSTMAARIRRAIEAYAADPTAHANYVTRLVGSSSSRMRVGDYRVIFVETEAALSVVRVGPRGGIYDEGT